MVLKILLFGNVYVTFFLLNAVFIAEEPNFMKLNVNFFINLLINI